jgi:dihydroorotase-like cyclic amidohydrolase
MALDPNGSVDDVVRSHAPHEPKGTLEFFASIACGRFGLETRRKCAWTFKRPGSAYAARRKRSARRRRTTYIDKYRYKDM